jgi:hypothetical protein
MPYYHSISENPKGRVTSRGSMEGERRLMAIAEVTGPAEICETTPRESRPSQLPAAVPARAGRRAAAVASGLMIAAVTAKAPANASQPAVP